MLDRSPFLQFTAPRLSKIFQRLERLAWRLDPEPLPVRRTAAMREHRPIADADGLAYTPVDSLPLHWGELFDQCFWKLDLSGRDTSGKYLRWCDQGEATVYRGQMPLYGFDPGHYYHPLPEGVTELTIESMCSRSGIWVTGEAQGTDPQGSRFEGAYLVTRDEHAWSMYLDFDVLLDLATTLITEQTPAKDPFSSAGYRTPFDTADPLVKRILVGLDHAADAVDDGDLARGADLTAALVEELRGRGGQDVHNVLTGHAHIDLVWLWTEAAGDFKAVHSFANALSLMERYEEFLMGYSQPASYDAIDRRAPELMRAVDRRVAEGRFEHAGATYVECDTQLPCGEALLRCFEVGQAELVRRFGKPSEVLWIPDVFGYSPCLPQVMRACGVKYFYTTKLHWSSATQFPFSSFRWQGHDGSEVLTHLSFHAYNELAKPSSLRFTAENHRQSGVHGEALAPTGYGDGGGGPTELMLERVRRCSDLAGVPRSQWGRIDAFFERLAERRDQLPVHRGEAYLEYHRGVQTTGVELKRAFRAAERGLQAWEAAHALTEGGGIDVQAWKRLTFAQFHDHIPGSSIERVYDTAIAELDALAQRGRAAAAEALEVHTKDAASIDSTQPCVFNPLPLPLLHRTDAGIVELPPLAGVTLGEASPCDEAVEASPTTLTSDRIAATFNERGEIASLTIDGHRLATTGPLAQVWTFADKPVTYDAWDIDRHTLSNGTLETATAEASVETAPGSASVAFTRPLAAGCTATVRYTLDAGSPVVRLDLDIDWPAPQRLLKLAFPTDYQGVHARYGAPFGSTLRPQHPGPLHHDAKFENPGSRWAAIADDTDRDGLMLATRSSFGFGCVQGLLHLSLLRSARYTQPNVAGSQSSLESPDEGVQFWDLGRRHVSLALGRYHADAPRHETPAALADRLFAEPVAYPGAAVASAMPTLEGGDSLVPAWVKPLEGGWLIRLHETLGRRGVCRFTAPRGGQVVACEPSGAPRGEAGDALDLAFRPYELTAVRVTP
mgnify:CR=1 FL=1